MAFPGINKQVDAVLYDASGTPITISAGGVTVWAFTSVPGFLDGVNGFVYGANPSGNPRPAIVMPYSYNGVTVDLVRGNVESTILTSAARTTTQTGADRTSYQCAGLQLFVSITVAGTGSITPSLQQKDSVSGDYKTIWTAAAALVANGDALYNFYPGAATLGSFTESLQMKIGRTYRWVITHNNANSITYSVGEVLLP